MSTLRVLFFGRVSDTFGAEREVAVEPGSTIADLRALLSAEHPGALDSARAAINKQVAAEDAPIRPGDEVAFFSMLSGG